MVDYLHTLLQYGIEKQDSGPLGDRNISEIYYLTFFALLGHITAVVLTFIIGKVDFLRFIFQVVNR